MPKAILISISTAPMRPTRTAYLIKGGGGALTREKIIAAASKKFVCIIDDSKLVDALGAFPLPVEVIPMARSYVARQLVKLGGQPVWREGVVTDNGNVILDVHHLRLTNPSRWRTPSIGSPGWSPSDCSRIAARGCAAGGGR